MTPKDEESMKKWIKEKAKEINETWAKRYPPETAEAADARISETLQLVEKIWKAYPSLRLGQLINNAVPLNCMYNIKDIDLRHALTLQYKHLLDK